MRFTKRLPRVDFAALAEKQLQIVADDLTKKVRAAGDDNQLADSTLCQLISVLRAKAAIYDFIEAEREAA